MTASRKNGAATGRNGPPVEHQFKPGNPGRPKGSRNKLGEAFLSALHDDFAEHGVEAIRRARDEDPVAYIRTIASLLPKDFNLSPTERPYREWTREELKQRLAEIRAQGGELDSDQLH